MLFAGCAGLFPKPQIVVQREIEQRRIPPSYMASCGKKWAGPETKVEHLYQRAESAESRADCRDAQIAKIKRWDAGP